MKLKQQNNKIICSTSHNPYYNLALEEYLLSKVKPNEVILYLWQNKNTVVIGSNQNPWRECDLLKIRSDDVKLVRRLSGGGAVYHDLGNLNFTFIASDDFYDVERQLSCILYAVNSFDLNAEFSGRNDILCNGKKFSGNAFYHEEHASYHHGTILIDVDLNKLSLYLTPSKLKIASKGINSVRSRVTNLHSLCSEINIDTMKSALCKSFKSFYGEISEYSECDEDTNIQEISELQKKYSSWFQSFGESPSFDVIHENKFDWGEISLGLTLRDAKIEGVEVYSDAIKVKFADKLKSALVGVKYTRQDINRAISKIKWHGDDEKIYHDILLLFEDI